MREIKQYLIDILMTCDAKIERVGHEQLTVTFRRPNGQEIESSLLLTDAETSGFTQQQLRDSALDNLFINSLNAADFFDLIPNGEPKGCANVRNILRPHFRT